MTLQVNITRLIARSDTSSEFAVPKGSRVSSIHDEVAAGIRVHEQPSDGSQLRPGCPRPKVISWREALPARPSIWTAVIPDGGDVSAEGPQAQPLAQPELGFHERSNFNPARYAIDNVLQFLFDLVR